MLGTESLRWNQTSRTCRSGTENVFELVRVISNGESPRLNHFARRYWLAADK